jgi:hypothetical protein
MAIQMRQEFVEGEVFALINVKVKWAALNKPDTRFEPCWKVDAVLSPDQAEKMKAVGFRIRQDADGDWVLRCKKKCRTKSGQPMEAPRVVGRDGVTPFTENIGNGSVMNINVFAKYIEVAGKTHLPAYLNEAQVVEHVPYTGGSPGFGNLEEGPQEQSDF